MNKKCKWIVCLGCLSALCFGAAACSKETKDDEMAKKGYVISVTYDPSGGSFFNLSGTTISDYFNPDSYTADDDGTVSIKLLNPLDEKRSTEENKAPKIVLGKSGYSLVGWYTDREIITNEEGEVLSEDGKVLTQKSDGSYYYEDEKNNQIECLPAYEYSGLWDFETRKLEYNAADYEDTNGIMSITLYAGWLPYYEFQYFYENEAGDWTNYGKTTFDYLSNKEANTDRDTIWVPRWQNEQKQSGAMDYSHVYATVSSTYSFPALAGTTFQKAYSDENCSQEITDSFVHQGTMQVDPCRAINSVQNVYVKLEQGERYRVTTAAELCDNGNAAGYYEIVNDLDLTGYTWPSVLTTGTFTGKFYAANGENVTISNANATISTEGDAYGGLFGYVAKGAEIKNVTFKDAHITLASVTSQRGQAIEKAAFGLLAGEIDEAATVSGVKLEGGTLELKDDTAKVGFTLSSGWKINAVANGDVSGVAHTAVTLVFVAIPYTDYFKYTYKPDTISVDEDGNVTFQIGSVYSDDDAWKDVLEEKYEIIYE